MAASLATMLFTVMLGEGRVSVATVLMTALVLILSEVLPKTYTITNAETVALPISTCSPSSFRPPLPLTG